MDLDKDTLLWHAYKRNPTPENRSAVVNQLGGLLHSQVSKWAGPVPADVLFGKAKVLAAKSLDTYDPSKGTALATHVTNSLLPLSRTVYTYQNTARMPENITQKLNAYNQVVNEHKLLHGVEPTEDEVLDKLQWSPSLVRRVREYNMRDLVESGGEISGKFHENSAWNDTDSDTLAGLHSTFDDTEKKVFEHSTGYNGAKKLSLDQMADKLGLTRAQVAYLKLNLRKKTEAYMNKPTMSAKYGK